MRKTKQLTLAALGAAMVLAPTAASAASVTSPDGGARASNSGTTSVTACDRKTDGNSAYSDYSANSSGRILTSGGNGSCATASMTGLRSFNACNQLPFQSDSCSSRVSP